MPAVLIVSAVVCALALDSGGYFPHAWVWSAVVLLWLAAVTVVVRSRVPGGRSALLFAGASAALAGWTLLSATWSVAPRQTVLEARRDLVYVGAAVVAVAALGRLGARAIPGGVLCAVTIVAIVGVARYVVSGPVDPAQGSLLSWPVGYANAFAALAAMALPPALALAAHARGDAPRRAAAGAVPILVAVPVLASSRGGILAAVAGLAALFALDVRRRALVHVALRLLPAAAVAVGAAAVGNVDTRRVALAAGIPLAVVAAVVAARRVTPTRPGPAVSRRTASYVAAGAVACAIAVSALPTRHLIGFQRESYWTVARSAIAADPLGGVGAGGFGRVWLEHGRRNLGALDVHNLYLETLVELGPLGLALVLLLVLLPLTRARAAARASRLGAAAAAGYVGFVVHALLDWDWEMPAVTVAGLALGGAVLVLAQRAPTLGSNRVRAVVAVAAVALALLALLGLRSSAVPAAARDATAAHLRRI